MLESVVPSVQQRLIVESTKWFNRYFFFDLCNIHDCINAQNNTGTNAMAVHGSNLFDGNTQSNKLLRGIDVMDAV